MEGLSCEGLNFVLMSCSFSPVPRKGGDFIFISQGPYHVSDSVNLNLGCVYYNKGTNPVLSCVGFTPTYECTRPLSICVSFHAFNFSLLDMTWSSRGELTYNIC